MKRLRWGLIGCGDISTKRVAPALRDLPNCDLVAVARARVDLAESFAQQFGARKWHPDWQALARDGEIDAVYIATPVHCHAAQTIAAAEAGKHILCEKPMAMNVEECERMTAACQAHHVKLGVAYYRHFYPAIARVKEIIRSGEIGQPVVTQLNAFERFNPKRDHPRHWFVEKAKAGGGPMFDFGCHRIEVLFANLLQFSECMGDSDFRIDLTETFPHLNNAPIVEAVIEVRTRAEAPWEESTVTQRFKAQLPEYPSVFSMNAVQEEFTFGTKVAASATHLLGWSGLRFQSADKLHVAEFKRDGFLFLRLRPYETWENLESEAKRLWQMYVEVARPTQAQRIGVRFINRIPMPINATRFEDYIQPHPETPRGLDLPYLNFLHRETFMVPGYDYGINLTRTLHIPQDRTVEGVGIILDIDVFTTREFLLDEREQERRLTEMRWLKNKTFFGTITPIALNNFR